MLSLSGWQGLGSLVWEVENQAETEGSGYLRSAGSKKEERSMHKCHEHA